MIEKEVLALYKRMKAKVLNTIKKDEIFGDFIQIYNSGERKFNFHNNEIKKSIDSDWVNAIESCIPSMETIIGNPRRYIKQESSVVPIEKARKITSESVKHLATNSQFISSVRDGVVTPNKILNIYNEETFDIYENRFVKTLIDRVSQFVDRRYYLLSEKGGDEFSSEFVSNGKFNQDDEFTDYNFSMKVHQGAEYLGGKGVAIDIFHRVTLVRDYIANFVNSPFMKELAGFGLVKPPIMKTNLIMKDPYYRACYDLWKFLDKYNKVGYKIDIVESNPVPQEEFLAEFNMLMVFQYLILKNEMRVYDDKEMEMDYRKRRTIMPKFARKLGDVSSLSELQEHPREIIKVNIDGSNIGAVNVRVRKAVRLALKVEERKQKAKIFAKKRERDERIAKVTLAIKRALSEAFEEKKQAYNAEKEQNREVAAKLQAMLKEEKERKEQQAKERRRVENEFIIKKSIEYALKNCKKMTRIGSEFDLVLPDRLLAKVKNDEANQLLEQFEVESTLISKRKEKGYNYGEDDDTGESVEDVIVEEATDDILEDRDIDSAIREVDLAIGDGESSEVVDYEVMDKSEFDKYLAYKVAENDKITHINVDGDASSPDDDGEIFEESDLVESLEPVSDDEELLDELEEDDEETAEISLEELVKKIKSDKQVAILAEREKQPEPQKRGFVAWVKGLFGKKK